MLAGLPVVSDVLRSPNPAVCGGHLGFNSVAGVAVFELHYAVFVPNGLDANSGSEGIDVRGDALFWQWT